ncbi:MAG: Hsp20/alpha crystallin family protein [Bdellovibrionales bacterium]|nr:Hsp20/alpha crystallin family protein [Bdellovibrionales bacterium]
MKALVPAWRSNSIAHNWFNEFDQLFEGLFENPQAQGFHPACEIEESEKFVLVSFDLPGLEEKDFKIEIDKNFLVLSGERVRKLASEGTTHTTYGSMYGVFRKSFRLPESIDIDKIEADYTHGVLKILLPKKEKEPAKKIEIQTKKGNLLSSILKGNPST